MALDRLHGWREIAKYLEVHIRTAQCYESRRGLPVYRFPGGGAKSPVFAVRAELDAWVETNIPTSQRTAMRAQDYALIGDQSLAIPILNRIGKLSSLKLYRRDYRLHFVLRSSLGGVRVNVGCRYKLYNPTNERQPFMQEITIDAPDHGYVEEMSFFTSEKPVYVLKRPRVAEKPVGYSIYRGAELLIEPSSRAVSYECRASWVINRSEDDFWSTHMMLPTIGITVETHAPSDFTITPSFSTPELVMTAEHLDVAWKRRPQRTSK